MYFIYFTIEVGFTYRYKIDNNYITQHDYGLYISSMNMISLCKRHITYTVNDLLFLNKIRFLINKRFT